MLLYDGRNISKVNPVSIHISLSAVEFFGRMLARGGDVRRPKFANTRVFM
jgi:hypothetical protein